MPGEAFAVKLAAEFAPQAIEASEALGARLLDEISPKLPGLIPSIVKVDNVSVGVLARSTGEISQGAVGNHLLLAKHELSSGLPERGWINYSSEFKFDPVTSIGTFQKRFRMLQS